MEFDDVYSEFEQNLERAHQISELVDTVIDIARGSIESLRPYAKSNPNTGANPVDNQVAILNQVQNSPAIKDTMAVVYGQQIVLFVSAFESYLRDLVRLLGNEYITSIKWPDKASGKIDLATLSKGSVTIGDLVLSIVEQHGFSFQDLQATKRFFTDYVGLEMDMDHQQEEHVILAAAVRNAVVHSEGIADTQFMKQIRNLDPDLVSSYHEGDPIELTQTHITEARDSLILYAGSLRDLLVAKVGQRRD